MHWWMCGEEWQYRDKDDIPLVSLEYDPHSDGFRLVKVICVSPSLDTIRVVAESLVNPVSVTA